MLCNAGSVTHNFEPHSCGFVLMIPLPTNSCKLDNKTPEAPARSSPSCMNIGLKSRMDNNRSGQTSRTASPLDVLLTKIPPHRETRTPEHLTKSETQVRISSSPRRSPQVTEALQSPARSVYALMQQMDSMHDHPDSGMRNTDFFDDSSDDDSAREVTAHDATAQDNALEQRRLRSRKRRSDLPDEPLPSQCEGKGSDPVERDHTGYQPLTPLLPLDDRATAQTSSSSLVGSVDELLSGGLSSPTQFASQARDPASDGVRRSTPNNRQSTDRLSKFDQTLGVYAIAHDITLQALMRNEGGLERKAQPYPPAALPSSDRESMLRRSFRTGSSPKSPRARHVSSPPIGNKKAHVTLPPIDTTASRRSLPTHFIPTPFSFSPEQARHKSSSKEGVSTSNTKKSSTVESVLTLSIRPSNPSRQWRVASLTIPASNDFSAVRSRSPRAKEQHFRALDFDDAALFRRLRKGYSDLMGYWRFFSARSLQRIIVSGPAMRQADREYWVHPPRSPRILTSNDLKDTFSQERILQHYRKPALGKSRYAFVHWAHRLAAAPSVQTPRSMLDVDPENGDLVRCGQQLEGLEFVVSWSVLRISMAFVTVIVIAVLAVLLWTFLGPGMVSVSPSHGKFHDAGDAVTTGVIIDICLLLLGLSGIAGWLGVSWLVM